MPYFLHQWRYKDEQIRDMLLSKEKRDRAEIVTTAVKAFDGTLHHFFYCFGDYDGTAITEFDNYEMALACVTAIYAQGRIYHVQTTPLFTTEQALGAMNVAATVLQPTR